MQNLVGVNRKTTLKWTFPEIGCEAVNRISQDRTGQGTVVCSCEHGMNVRVSKEGDNFFTIGEVAKLTRSADGTFLTMELYAQAGRYNLNRLVAQVMERRKKSREPHHVPFSQAEVIIKSSN
jgi:hypothetical protein